jgi:hypothetical protein
MATFSAAKRRNVSPKSSTLNVVTRDIDCSGMNHTPEDGQWVPQDGDPAGGDPGNVLWHHGTEASVTATRNMASSIAMVWSSAQRSDRQALGDTRVPVLMHGGIEVECKLFETNGGNILADFPIGSLVTLTKATDALTNVANDVPGTNNRLVCTPLPAANFGWAVGYVISAPDATAADDQAITIYLYDKPRLVGSNLNA